MTHYTVGIHWLQIQLQDDVVTEFTTISKVELNTY